MPSARDAAYLVVASGAHQSDAGRSADGFFAVWARLHDVKVTMGALEELLNPDEENYISKEFPDLILQAKANFIAAYVKERGMDTSKRPNYNYFIDNSSWDPI